MKKAATVFQRTKHIWGWEWWWRVSARRKTGRKSENTVYFCLAYSTQCMLFNEWIKYSPRSQEQYIGATIYQLSRYFNPFHRKCYCHYFGKQEIASVCDAKRCCTAHIFLHNMSFNAIHSISSYISSFKRDSFFHSISNYTPSGTGNPFNLKHLNFTQRTSIITTIKCDVYHLYSTIFDLPSK